MWRRSYQIVESGQSRLWPHNSGINIEVYTFEDFYLPSFQKINGLLLVLKDRWDLKL